MVLERRAVACLKGGPNGGREEFNGGLEMLRVEGWEDIEEELKGGRIPNVGKLELDFWGLGNLGDLDNLREAEVSDHREIAIVKAVERVEYR